MFKAEASKVKKKINFDKDGGAKRFKEVKVKNEVVVVVRWGVKRVIREKSETRRGWGWGRGG